MVPSAYKPFHVVAGDKFLLRMVLLHIKDPATLKLAII